MKGFGILLALASAAILMICGPPAIDAGENTYILQNDSLHVEANNAAVAGQQRLGCRLLNFLPSG